MNVTLISISRFHHFHLARQLESRNRLSAIYTGYPQFKLKDEQGLPREKIRTYPWLHAPFMARSRVGLDRWQWLDREWAWWATDSLDRFVARKLQAATILIALSGMGLHAGRKSQALGGIHVCDRGSSHIRLQDELMYEEHQRYGVQWPGIDPRFIAKEEAEYEQANWISLPSQFCIDSFIAKGIAKEKLLKISYGARLERFRRISPPAEEENGEFRILFVGAAGPRKGFVDLLSAFQAFSHPRKRLILIGSLTPEARALLSQCDHSQITVLGAVPNHQLTEHYSRASVFVLPSIEEGLAMVIGEAMACGCPVIATTNTGASELITDGVEGFIVPIRSPDHIAERLHQLADHTQLRHRMGEAALARVQRLGGWDTYGVLWAKALEQMKSALAS